MVALTVKTGGADDLRTSVTPQTSLEPIIDVSESSVSANNETVSHTGEAVAKGQRQAQFASGHLFPKFVPKHALVLQTALCLALVGGAIVIVIYFVVAQAENKSDMQTTRNMCSHAQLRLQIAINSTLDTLWATALLFGRGDVPSRTSFYTWAKIAESRRTFFIYFLFAAKVDQSNRNDYENRFGPIMDSPFNHSPASSALFYFPAVHMYPIFDPPGLSTCCITVVVGFF